VYFAIFVEHALSAGVVQTTPDRTAVALWLPVTEPGSDGPPPDYDARLSAATSPWTDRFRAFDQALEAGHPASPAHHHLAILAVRPGRQGQGTGTRLLEAYHRELDEAGAPAYLEASDPRSRHLYLRHGYVDLDEPIQLPGGPAMYPMWRTPRTP
jgi:GNAT superfamily N-acetyltransferase